MHVHGTYTSLVSLIKQQDSIALYQCLFIHSSISLSHFFLLLNFQTHRICEGWFFYASNWCYVLIVWSHEKCINKIWRNLITAEFVKVFIWESRPKNKKEKSPNYTTFKQIYKYLNIFESLVNVCWCGCGMTNECLLIYNIIHWMPLHYSVTSFEWYQVYKCFCCSSYSSRSWNQCRCCVALRQ